ncbi:MAG TPA: hypothetical protein VHB97_06895 [Polyangia bacterium]|nr:hypothetical protein [Polyangia bacterium]
MAACGVAAADHTKEDAQATTAKLEAILHPPKSKRQAKAKTPPPVANGTQTSAQAQTQKAAHSTVVVDPLYSLIVHAFTIPFDPKEREAHLRDIPKNAKELDAHLRRLDAALRAPRAALTPR